MNIRVPLILTLLVIACDRPALAQSGFSGYMVGGVGSTPQLSSHGPKTYAGGGAEIVSQLGLGAGVDAGVFVDHSGVVLMLVSIDAVLQLRRASRGAIPFFTAGYTAATTPEPSFTAWNFGAGINFVRGSRSAWRLEFRNHVRTDRIASHYWVLRGGISFR